MGRSNPPTMNVSPTCFQALPVERLGRAMPRRTTQAVSLDRVAQQYARVVTGIGTDQLWAALRQWGAATLTGREGL